ncbi:maltose ABC transporter permease [Cryobacterium roopkundense]|uniref:Maltose/maltodextrin transport system permease protein n=1 Tax=Cryobacterium roopkundense TaxID=1001240 RepID=A0A099J2K6_9MICO|nr:ABC transporter permease subunit [Cryobacterium roopkundense]KGJ72315.1 maltose ABC transporter permease [Cryobacterium roopkundense]MBB5643504.1 arabinogalactan oligomer/maltooligosaccharide transport system permease protein [Cryobacterium roopkundense]
MTRTQTLRDDAQVKKAKQSRRAGRIADAASVGVKVLLLKILLLGVVDAISLYALFVLGLNRDWLVFGLVLAVALAVNWVYFRRGGLPAKYLTPGLIFLAIFQIFVIGYSGYIAFTNYGTGHNSTKDDAVNALIVGSQQRVPDSPSYDLTVLERLGQYSFLVTDPDGTASVGDELTPLREVNNAETDAAGQAVALPGYTTLGFSDIVANQQAIAALSVPTSDDPNDGTLRTPDGSSAYLYLSDLLYDEAADTMTDTTKNLVYSADESTGAFVASDGSQLLPGWKVEIGFDNFTKAFTTESIRGPLISVTIWTFAFAFLSVGTAFGLGLFLAIVFNDMRMRGRNVYRVILILPYAFPGFLSALVWAGMLNPQFGFVNQVLFGGADIPWLTNEWLAKFSIIFVNLWLTFPYMFLVTTGALQSIPEELQEAAKVDGAKPWAIFRLIKLPLLLVSVAPLLIASFAFAFNNFNLVFMLTNGGPRDVTAGVNVGATDILITMVYKVAFVGANRDYGLASAFSIIIFLLVALVSIISFKQTKALEELN